MQENFKLTIKNSFLKKIVKSVIFERFDDDLKCEESFTFFFCILEMHVSEQMEPIFENV